MPRLIDADALIAETTKLRCTDCKRRKGMKNGKLKFVYAIGEAPCRACDVADMIDALEEAPTVPDGWISVKDDLPKEHPSMFAALYGTDKWNRAMWRTESDRVLVTIQFPDGTRTVDKGKLQDGTWKTGVSPVLPQVVTHWAMWPEPPKEEEHAPDRR